MQGAAPMLQGIRPRWRIEVMEAMKVGQPASSRARLNPWRRSSSIDAGDERDQCLEDRFRWSWEDAARHAQLLGLTTAGASPGAGDAPQSGLPRFGDGVP